MNLQGNNNRGHPGGNCKYLHEHGYEAGMGRYLYDPEVFSNMSIDMLRRYNQQHALLFVSLLCNHDT